MLPVLSVGSLILGPAIKRAIPIVVRQFSKKNVMALAVTGGAAVGAEQLMNDEPQLEDFRADMSKDYGLDKAEHQQAREEFARAAAHMYQSIINGETFWPTGRDGTPISPNYFVYCYNGMRAGQSWFLENYTSGKTVRAASNRARFRGHSSGRRHTREMVRTYGKR